MRLILLLVGVLLVTGCSTVSTEDKNFFYRGWVHPKTSDDSDPVPPLGYYKGF